MNQTEFGSLPDGRTVHSHKLTSPNGLEVRVLDYGGIVQSIRAPGRDGVLTDVVLGYDNLQGYLAGTAYVGAIIGRYASRIADSRFLLEERWFQLAANEGEHHLHGHST